MAIDRRTDDDLEATRWRDAHELQALRDMVGMYRRGAAALAAEVTELRAETARLRDRRVRRGSQLIEVEIELDEYAQDLVAAILTAELGGLEAPALEDVLLVARELTVASLHRCPSTARAMMRVEHSPTTLRVAVQALGSEPEPARPNIIERLSERWGTEQVSSGGATVWAQLALTRPG